VEILILLGLVMMVVGAYERGFASASNGPWCRELRAREHARHAAKAAA
jgi:hypothetical protein